jgi:hypothetical protein
VESQWMIKIKQTALKQMGEGGEKRERETGEEGLL